MSLPPRFAAPARPPLFSRTPPAVFPAVLGLFGLGLAWRVGEPAFGMPSAPVEAYLGAVSLLYLFCLVAYLAKLARRPGVAPEDFRVLPGRAGLATLTMGAMALSAVLFPYAPSVAPVVLIAALVIHGAVAVWAGRTFLAGPPEARQVTPVMHLTFVGPIVGAVAAAQMGLTALAVAVMWYSLAAAVLVWGFGLRPLLSGAAPPPLRPTQAIHLAPAALVGTAAQLLGYTTLAALLAAIGGALFVVLVVRARWLTAAGFSGFWSSFTFPVASYAGLLFLVAAGQGSEALRIAGGLVLVFATLIIPPIAAKVMQLWAKGTLAAKTNAAQA